MNRPAKILNLWQRLTADESAYAPANKARDTQFKKGITKSLDGLRKRAKPGLTEESEEGQQFLGQRDQAGKKMRNYCRSLKRIQNKRFLTKVKGLTTAVMALGLNNLDSEDGLGNVDALERLDQTALEHVLDQPDEDVGEDEDLLRGSQPGQKTVPPAPPGAAAGDGAARFTARLKALLPAIQKAQGDNTPAAQDIKLRVSQANVFARKNDFAQANDLLDNVESLLKETQTGETNGAQAGDQPGKPPSLVVLQQSRLAWDQTRKVIQAELQKLEKSVVGTCQGDEEVDVAEVSGNVKRLFTILDNLDTRLSDKLDEALNAADPRPRAQLHQQARGIIGEYLAFVNGDALMADIDDNGFTPVAVRKTALNALNLLSSKL
jgi:hypothetical protein